MAYDITDYDELEIYVTDGWREWYIPKFRIFMTVDGDFANLYWTDTEKGASGVTRLLSLDYNDVTFGYIAPSSAGEVVLQIESYQLSAFGGVGGVQSVTDNGNGVVTVDNTDPLNPVIEYNPEQTVKHETGDYTLVIGDEFNFIEFDDVGGAVDITVPTNASEPFPIGTWIDLWRDTSEIVNIVPDIGVTINSRSGYLSLDTLYSKARIVKVGTNEWDLFGDLELSLDPDANAIIDAIGGLTDVEKIAINDWFVSAKANGYYSKLKVVTAHCFGSAANNKWNWVNPVDSNAAFRTTYYGSPTFNARSVLFNGTTQYFRNLWDTAVNLLTAYSTTLIQCFTSNTSNNGTSFGLVNGANVWAFIPKFSGTLYSDAYNQGTNRKSVVNADATGIYVQTRQSNVLHKVFKAGVQITVTDTNLSSNFASLTLEPYWMCWNNAGSPAAYFNGEIWFSALGDGFTDGEVAAISTDLATLKTAIGA
jgi:hypothetical protein